MHPGIAFLKELFGGVPNRDCAVRFWNGTTWEPEAGQPTRFTFVLKHPGAVRNMFWPPRFLAVSEAFLFDDFDLEGDVTAFCRFCERLEDYSNTFSLLKKLKSAWCLWQMPRVEQVRAGRQAVQLDGTAHTRERDRKAVSFHYDLSNEFFNLFLGPVMGYTCGIFAHPDEGLDASQQRRNDVVCRKLRIKPGERFLDIGCGWGELVIHAAKHYGAKCVGVTISERQVEWARRRIREEGLADQCRIDLLDYRDIGEREPFDKIATVEVIEHFGRGQYPAYFAKCRRLLRPQGSLLVQQITMNDLSRVRRGTREFSDAYIFPDGEFAATTDTQSAAEKVGFEVRDVEAFREHYCLTLRLWLNNLESRHDEIVRITDEATYRAFRLYLAGAHELFCNSRYNVHQMLFAKSEGSISGYPLGREDWYTNGNNS